MEKRGFKVEGYEYTFPFVDIWILYSSKKINKGETNDGYKFDYDTYYPLKKFPLKTTTSTRLTKVLLY